MVTREQQAVFEQGQAQVVGGMARGVQHLEAVLAHFQNFAVRQCAVGCELALRVGSASRGQAQNGRQAQRRSLAQSLQRLSAGRVIGVRMGANDVANLATGGAPNFF